ncbi:phosphoribosyltransferase family protein [Mesorhizobium sp. Cs1321R2N1]|uniref:phosphoribosyltransferase family protein n=1 Tax=Mesorhizobium sp. Cs1321R2N1 TaxID=3015174 RepID=UPI00301D2D49
MASLGQLGIASKSVEAETAHFGLKLMTVVFSDRREAGRKLATELKDYAGRRDVIVLALPRGGVPVAYEVARALKAPLDVFVVRKLGVPGCEELAMGAIATSGVRVLTGALSAGTIWILRCSVPGKAEVDAPNWVNDTNGLDR